MHPTDTAPGARRARGRIRLTVAALATQGVAIVFFVGDVIWDLAEIATPQSNEHWWHAALELTAVVSLVVAFGVTLSILSGLYARLSEARAALGAARNAFSEVLSAAFEDWHLTPAERDVALLSIKGLSIGEIASLRATREGTVKAQLNAIYAKAGVSGRAQLLAHFIEILLGGRETGAPR